MRKLAFIGLGVMGHPMAGHLANAGHIVTVYNRTGSKAEAWAKNYNGSKVSTPALAASQADIVFTCVGAPLFMATRGFSLGCIQVPY